MADKRTREKRRMKRYRDSVKKDIEEQDETDSPLFVGGDIETGSTEEASGEPLEKYSDMAMPMPGPTSYAELDAAKAAREQADRVRQESWTVQDLVYNIAYSMLDPEEKSKAIVQVGRDFGKRLKSIASEKVEKELDLELLEIRALLGRDSRSTSLIEKTVNLFSTSPDNLLRKQLKDVAKLLERELENEARATVEGLLKSARDAGVGGDPSILIEKDATGTWRAVLFPSNNFKDRDGEIIASSAHEEYVEWVNKNMSDSAPVFATWHVPGTARTNPIDFVGFENGFLIESCPLTIEEAAALLKMQESVDIGLSIGGVALQRDKTDANIILKYRQFEVSDLPLARAANPFTDIELVSKEAHMKSDEMKKYLASMLGEERAAAVFDKMAISQEELRKAGVEEKEAKEPAPAAKTEVAAPAPKMDEIVERVFKELGVDELSKEFADLKANSEKVPVLEELIKQLLAAKDDQLAEMINPRISKQLSWMGTRPSQKKETLLKDDNDEDEKLKKAAPELGWLSEATRTTPVQV